MKTIPVWPSVAQASGFMARQLRNLSTTPAGPHDTTATPAWCPAAAATSTQRVAQSETAGTWEPA